MDVYLTDLRGLSDHATHQGRQAADLGEHAINQGRQAVDLGEHVPDLGARGKISRARALLTFLRAKTLAAANVASQSGLRAAGDLRKGMIERTVRRRAYLRWTMFDQTFNSTSSSTGSRPGGAHGVGGARRRAWVLSPARVIVLMGFRRDWIRGVV